MEASLGGVIDQLDPYAVGTDDEDRMVRSHVRRAGLKTDTLGPQFLGRRIQVCDGPAHVIDRAALRPRWRPCDRFDEHPSVAVANAGDQPGEAGDLPAENVRVPFERRPRIGRGR